MHKSLLYAILTCFCPSFLKKSSTPSTANDVDNLIAIYLFAFRRQNTKNSFVKKAMNYSGSFSAKFKNTMKIDSSGSFSFEFRQFHCKSQMVTCRSLLISSPLFQTAPRRQLSFQNDWTSIPHPTKNPKISF